ncbi:filamin-A isoform X4 [Planococcus citri]|uniref:filamin-A isoform X4 n=1 Tax=Planococcus citri TaxID=170843 RepID=UPI0031F91880
MSSLRVSQIGLVARSPEGHAAKGMPIKGHEDLWIDIQANTFRNWINEHLKSVDMRVVNLASDFGDGTKLCALVEVLQKRIIKPHWNRKPTNQHQYLENVSCALNAIAEDGVKLVNIGNIDIVNGNLKLILGLIWSLIVRYQIGPSKFPPKKLMLAWLKAVLPDCSVNNLTSDWNSGINLSALLDYCQPGLFSNWRELDPSDSIENCRTAMELARQEFNVPMVLEPEYLASPFLDELSGMTYLSYFMKEDSPGFKSTLRWVNSRLKNRPVRNFTTDWNDGRALCTLVKSLGGSAKYEDSDDTSVWLSNLNSGIYAGRRLGVDPLLSAKDMVNQNVEHLGVMAYAASFQWIPPRTHPSAVVAATSDSHTTRVYQPTTINLDFSSSEVNLKEITAEIIGPECNKVECRLTLGLSGGKGTFVPMQVGMHKIIVYNEEEIVRGCPLYIRAMPELTSIKHTGLEPCAVGSIVEVIVNSNGAKAGLIEVTATSPTGRELLCPVHEREGIYRATFEPDEPGEWSIAVRHSGELIDGGPFPCFVFDPNGVELIGLDKSAVPEGIFNFTLDARGTGGLGNIVIDIVYNKQSLPHTIDHIGNSIYRVSLHTRRPGKYKLYIYFNGNQIKGSPFPLRVGTKEQQRVERQSSFSKHYDRSSYNNNYEFKEENSSDSYYHRISSPSRSPSHSPSPHLHASSPVNVRNSESSSIHKSAFKVTSNSSSKMVDSLLRSRLSPINNSSDYSYKNVNSSSSMQNSSYRNGSPSSHITKHNSTSNNHSVKYLNTSSSIRMSPSSPTAHFKSILNSNSKSSTPVNGHALDIKVTGDALHLLPIHKPSTIYIHTDATLPNVLVTVTSPSSSTLPVRLSRNVIDNVVSASFTPVEIGEHAIDVKINNERIAASPFRTHAYNSLAIKVASIPDGYVGQAVEFEIDGSGAGSGNLEILVNGGHVTSFVRNLGNQRFLASFVPHEAVIHKIDMKFNNEPVIGSPWEISVMPSGTVGPKMSVIGEAVRLVPANHSASFQISAIGFRRSDLRATVMSPSKRNLPTSIFSEGSNGVFRIEFIPTEVGSHLIDVSVAGDKLIGGPLVAKVYNTSYIHVTDVKNGVVGQPCQFKVDASEAGEGQLEISINEGEVPNHVTVVGGGRCLVSFTPEQPKPHLIDIKFNGETVSGCPFVCSVSDTSRVSVNFSSLELIPVNQVARFHMTVDNSASAELSVSVTGPTSELPVKVTGNVHSGFTAEFTPQQVGSHTIAVDYNGHPIYGTPFVSKVYDAKQVIVGNVPKGHVGNTLQFTVDASQAGEGNLEITISARGTNIPTQVHPQRNAKFTVSFVPIEPTDHIISIHFNKEPVPGSPFIANVSGDFPLVNGAALNSAPVGSNSYFTMSNVSGNLEDIEVNVEGTKLNKLRLY